jgi:hypothetical protein
MRTRSQDAKDVTSVVIDFDEASREWNRNKIRRGQMYFYICGFTLANGRSCQRCPKNGETHCYRHQKNSGGQMC